MSEKSTSEKMPFLLINSKNEVFEFHVEMSGIWVSSLDIERLHLPIEDFLSSEFDSGLHLPGTQPYYIVQGEPIEMSMQLQRFIDLLRNLDHQIKTQASAEARQQALKKTIGNR